MLVVDQLQKGTRRNKSWKMVKVWIVFEIFMILLRIIGSITLLSVMKAETGDVYDSKELSEWEYQEFSNCTESFNTITSWQCGWQVTFVICLITALFDRGRKSLTVSIYRGFLRGIQVYFGIISFIF